MRTVLIAALILAVAGSAYSQSIYRMYNFTWGGAFTPCTNCGGPDGAFACSNNIGNWNDGINKVKFYKDIPEGYVLTGLTATVKGTYNCLNNGFKSVVGVYFQDTPVDVQVLDGSNQCKCGTCDGDRTFNNHFFRAGWPNVNYKYNEGPNIVRVVPGAENPICLSSMMMNATFTKTNRRTEIVDLVAGNTTSAFGSCASSSVKICGNAPGQYWVSSAGNYFQFLDLKFNDPVGSQGRVIAVDALIYAQWGKNYNQDYPATVSVQGQLIDGAKATVYSDACVGCGGAFSVYTPQPFQFGWPNYAVGGVNTLSIKVDRRGNSAYPFAISRVVLSISYI